MYIYIYIYILYVANFAKFGRTLNYRTELVTQANIALPKNTRVYYTVLSLL